MKREILFRGKGVNDGNWLYGYYLKYTDIVGEVTAVCPLPEEGKYYHIEDCYVDPTTVGQFTGLYDKNGKKVFEGDIIKTDYHELKMVVCYNTRLASFSLENGHWMYPHYFEEAVRTKDVEVIGNIHDTPDLGKEVSE